MTKKKNHAWLNCSEKQLTSNIQEWLQTQSMDFKNTIMFLKGEMGAGKSTFARVLLSELVQNFSSQGSPTFPLVQEYRSQSGFPIYHIDLYRLKNEHELEDSGILHQIEEQGALSLVEWPDLFPAVFSFWRDSSRMRPKQVVEVSIKNGNGDELRDYRISVR